MLELKKVEISDCTSAGKLRVGNTTHERLACTSLESDFSCALGPFEPLECNEAILTQAQFGQIPEQWQKDHAPRQALQVTIKPGARPQTELVQQRQRERQDRRRRLGWESCC